MAGLGKKRPGWASKGGRKKRAGGKPREVAGPYRDQSSVPSIRKKATPHEHRKVPVHPEGRTPTPDEVFGTTDLAPPTPSERRRQQRERRTEQRTQRHIERLLNLAPVGPTPRSPAVPTLTVKRPDNRPGYTPDPLAVAVERDVVQPLQAEGKLPKHKTLGQDISDKVADAVVNYGIPAAAMAPELSALAKGASLAVRGAEVGDEVVGGSRLAQKLGAKPVSAPDTLSNQAAVAANKADQQVARVGRSADRTLSEGDASQAVKAWEKAKAAARKVNRSEAKADRTLARDLTDRPTAKATLLGDRSATAVATKAGGSQFAPVIQGHEKALVENPGKVIGTTARALPGFVTVPVGLTVNAAITPGRAVSAGLHEFGVPGFKAYSGKEIIAPIKYEGKSQLAFMKEVAKVVTADDPAEVQKAVEDELGLLLPITAGLGIKAGLDHIPVGDASAAEALVAKVRTSAEKWRGKLEYTGVGRSLDLAPHGEGARVFEKAGQRKQAAKTSHNAASRIRSEVGDRSAGITQAYRKGRRGRPSDELRPRQGREVDGSRSAVTVEPTDATRFLIANGIDLDAPLDVLEPEIHRLSQKLEQHRKELKLPARLTAAEKGDIPDAEDILDALKRHPDWLKRKDLRNTVEVARVQERDARSTPGMSPAHSEAARFTPMAVNHGVPTAAERIPLELRDQYGGAKLWREVPGLEEFLNKHPDAELDKEMVDEVKQRIAEHPALTDPEWTSERITKEQPGRLVNSGVKQPLPGGVKHRTGMAARLGTTHESLPSYIRDSIQRNVAQKHLFQAIKAGVDKHQYRQEAPLSDAAEKLLDESFPGHGGYWTEADAREVVDGFREGTPDQRKRADEIEAQLKASPAGQHLFTSDEARRLFDSADNHLNRKNFVLLPEQLVKRVDDYDAMGERAGEEEAWVSDMVSDLNPDEQDRILTGNAEKGRKYRIVPKAYADQLFSEMQRAGKAGQIFSRLNRMSTGLMLHTSPAWALTQIGAEYAQAALAEPKLLNPAYVRTVVKAYHAMDPEKRRAFESWVGVTQRSLDDPREPGLSMATADDAYQAMNRTQLGKALRSVPHVLRTIDQWKGGRIRVLLTAAKMDRDLNSHMSRFLQGAGNLYREQEKIARQFKGRPLKDVLGHWADDPAGVERYQSYLDDMMGSWSALTKNEQTAARVLIFYPFLRMSLKWTFVSFPREHPIRAAASYWLGQQNANELHDLLGGDPRFFGEWGNVPIHLDSGKPTSYLPLSRLSVAGNALVEALGGGLGDPTKGPPLTTLGLSLAQPALVSGARLATGINKFTGKQEANSAAGAANEVLSLTGLGRTAEKLLEEHTGTTPKDGSLDLIFAGIPGAAKEQDALDKLIAKLRGSATKQALATIAVPELPQSVDDARDQVKLNHILDTMSLSGSDAHSRQEDEYREQGKTGREAQEAGDELWNVYDGALFELHKLYRKHKIPGWRKEDEDFDRFSEEARHRPSKTEELKESFGIQTAPSLNALKRQFGVDPGDQPETSKLQQMKDQFLGTR